MSSPVILITRIIFDTSALILNMTLYLPLVNEIPISILPSLLMKRSSSPGLQELYKTSNIIQRDSLCSMKKRYLNTFAA